MASHLRARVIFAQSLIICETLEEFIKCQLSGNIYLRKCIYTWTHITTHKAEKVHDTHTYTRTQYTHTHTHTHTQTHSHTNSVGQVDYKSQICQANVSVHFLIILNAFTGFTGQLCMTLNNCALIIYIYIYIYIYICI